MSNQWKKNEINFVIKEYKKGHGRGAIAKLFRQKYGSNRTENSIKHCIQTYGAEVERDIKKVLVLDIETSPMVSYTWGLWDQNIGLNQVKNEGGILSWSCKWLGCKQVYYSDVKGDMSKEKKLLIPLWKMMDEADIVIGQASNNFDLKKLNAKFLEHKLGCPSKYKKIDTVVIARKHFSFVSNKLEWMSKKFCKIKKLAHSKFPGFSLWLECLKGNKQAWAEMRRYNMQDVIATEELFIVLSEFEKTTDVADAIRTYNYNKKNKL